MFSPKPSKRLTFVDVTRRTLPQDLVPIDLEIPNSNYTVCLTLHPIILNLITLLHPLHLPPINSKTHKHFKKIELAVGLAGWVEMEGVG